MIPLQYNARQGDQKLVSLNDTKHDDPVIYIPSMDVDRYYVLTKSADLKCANMFRNLKQNECT